MVPPRTDRFTVVRSSYFWRGTVDVVAIMKALAEQGTTVLFKADAERMAERRKPLTFVVSGAP